ncbi:hypothetical protein F5148DRAFT_1252911 [Russula earlei]|uniref:Uncharacterized protein n=1 Tax=Russula earlei TaxID=71964 RepID=A0ACC0TT28_9AGAM|nr:hypothetical protein F5148DRAFT_1252911 [Russula earlei]
MRTSSIFVIFCLTLGTAPSFALPLDVRSPDPVLHTRGGCVSQPEPENEEGATKPTPSSNPPRSPSLRSSGSSSSSSLSGSSSPSSSSESYLRMKTKGERG